MMLLIMSLIFIFIYAMGGIQTYWMMTKDDEDAFTSKEIVIWVTVWPFFVVMSLVAIIAMKQYRKYHD